MRFLGKEPRDFEEIHKALHRAIHLIPRATGIFDNIRALFRKISPERELVDLNEVVREALKSLSIQLSDNGIDVQTTLASELPPVEGHRGQLLEVIVNLVKNAIEAMGTINDQNRVLTIQTKRNVDGAILVFVEDAGPGIEPDKVQSIFDAFFTTKADGIGLA